MRVVPLLFVCLVMLAQSANAQSAGETRLPAVTGEAENPPVIQSVTYRLNSPASNGANWDFVVDIHFVASQGNATTLHMQLVRNPGGYRVSPVPINIPADAQKSGAVASIHLGIRQCSGPDTATSEAYIVDSNGNHSNAVRFSTHCPGNSHGADSRPLNRQSLPTFDQQVQVSPDKYVDTPVPHTGTEAALRNFIEGTEKGEPRSEFMSPNAPPETAARSAAINRLMDGWGNLRTITFRAVDAQGFDTYLVEFEHGEYIWTIPQLAADGKLVGFAFEPSTTNTSPAAAHDAQSSPVAAPNIPPTHCNAPDQPSAVDGTAITPDQLNASIRAAKLFMTTSDVYQDCLGKEIDAQKAAATIDKPFDKAIADRDLALVAANQKMKENVAASVNTAIAIYKKARPAQ